MALRRSAAVAVSLAASGLLIAATPDEPPSAFDLLQELKQTYAGLDSYQDLGEIEKTVGEGSDATSTLLFFETNVGADNRYLWRVHGETEHGFEERTLWNDGEESYVFRSLFQQYKSIPSLAAELATGFGEGGFEALVVPLALAGDVSSFATPEGAVVEGPEPCGDASCWVLLTSRMGGSIEGELWIDRDTRLIREVRVRLEDRAAIFASALDDSLSRDDLAPASAELTTIHVRHHPITDSPGEFQLPEGARQVAEWEPDKSTSKLATSDPGTGDPGTGESWLDLGLTEEITVSLFSVVARIVDARGEPVVGLEPADLLVRIGRQEIPIQSLDWSSSYQDSAEIPIGDLAEARTIAHSGGLTMIESPASAPGKTLVLFLQIDFAPSRLKGHLKLLPDIEQLLQSLHPNDRVAILSFDSHLKLWQDFSRDRELTFETLKQAVSTGLPTARRGRKDSLNEHFNFRAAKDVASPERALEVIADALAPMPGEKEIIYLGWGLGQYNGGIVQMTADYAPAVRALDAADATVFVLDVSQADSHSLELGLQQVASHTGGTYDRTFHFSSQAVKRLTRALNGHYVVNIDRSALPEAKGRLTITLRSHTGRVLFRPIVLG